MSYQRITLGDPILLRLQAGDAATDRYPLAYVYDSAHAAVAGSPFTLTHQANGLYTNEAFTPGVEDHYDAVYKMFQDVGHTTIDPLYNVVTDSFDIYTPSSGGGGGSVSGGKMIIAIVRQDQTVIELRTAEMAATVSTGLVMPQLASAVIAHQVVAGQVTAQLATAGIVTSVKALALNAVVTENRVTPTVKIDTLIVQVKCE